MDTQYKMGDIVEVSEVHVDDRELRQPTLTFMVVAFRAHEAKEYYLNPYSLNKKSHPKPMAMYSSTRRDKEGHKNNVYIVVPSAYSPSPLEAVETAPETIEI